MYKHLFDEFMTCDDTLRVYEDNRLIHASNKRGLLPILEYLQMFDDYHQIVIFDKLLGNAAALLAIKANCRELYSPLGSQIATKTLDKYSIKYYINEIVPNIQRPGGFDICPMEKLSVDKGPEDFYELIRNIIK